MFLATVGSLPPYRIDEDYPYCHIRYWARALMRLGYNVVGTGEPGWRNGLRMVERFTQDIDGIELRRFGSMFKSYCVNTITKPRNPDSVKEVLENKYLRSIVSSPAVKLKATVTDPVTIGVELIANNLRLVRGYLDLFNALTQALSPTLEWLSTIVDILQLDCPAHSTSPVKEPWKYVNELVRNRRGKPVWLHVDGSVKRVIADLVSKYEVDVLAINLFGREEEENFLALANNHRELREHGKKIGVSCVNTQIQDNPAEVDGEDVVFRRLKRLEETLGGELDLVECVMPGCGLNLLPFTSPMILERVVSMVKEMGWT